MLPSNATGRRLPDIFVDDSAVARNETEASAWNVVDRGGSLLERHRSVDTLSVVTLNLDVDASTSSSLCHPLHSSLVVLAVLLCCAATRLRRSTYRKYFVCSTSGITSAPRGFISGR